VSVRAGACACRVLACKCVREIESLQVCVRACMFHAYRGEIVRVGRCSLGELRAREENVHQLALIEGGKTTVFCQHTQKKSMGTGRRLELG
jgi:hypothetical protein